MSRDAGTSVIQIVIHSTEMPRAISVRLDDDALRALRVLEATGMSRSDAIRTAILEASARRRQSDALRAEIAAVAGDERDRAELAAVLADMEDARDPW